MVVAAAACSGHPGLVPHERALDCGCRQGGPGNVRGTDPAWVAVERPERAVTLDGTVRHVYLAHEDWLWSHDSHDVCFYVAPDLSCRHLLSDASRIHGGERVLEVEWERACFDARFWPVPGDRVRVVGRWVFDCAHPPYRTEIHPPKGVAVMREVVLTLPGETTPCRAVRLAAYLHGEGGYHYDPVEGRDYVFEAALPLRPSPAAHPRAALLEPPSGEPPPRVTLVGGGDAWRLRVVWRLRDVPAFAPRWNLFERRARWFAQDPRARAGRRFTLERPQGSPRYSCVAAAGWIDPTAPPRYRTLRVTLEEIVVHDDHDAGASGEWKLWIAVGGRWFRVPNLDDVDDGEVVRVDRAFDLSVLEDRGFAVLATGWEDDNDGLLGVRLGPSALDVGALDRNAALGTLHVRHDERDDFGLGRHEVRSSRGDWSLRYRVEERRAEH